MGMIKTFLSNNPYSQLAAILSPLENHDAVDELQKLTREGVVDWNTLLLLSNMHFCTPLWFVRLRQRGMLTELKEELQEYLAQLHAANLERNAAFRQALRVLLDELQSLEIPAVLLKGAATFCDDLYRDDGARMMGDIDVLVARKEAARVCDLLLQWGYVHLSGGNPSYSPEYRSQHLPRMVRPASPVVFEIHLEVARGHAGRLLPTDFAWEGLQNATFEGCDTQVLNPTLRLLHNTVHALSSQRAYIRSCLSLMQLTEFVSLALKYHGDIDWDLWFKTGEKHDLGRQFASYIHLAHRLMDLPIPSCIPRFNWIEMDIIRLIAGGGDLAPPTGSAESLFERAERQLSRSWINGYYRLAVPLWLWRNIAYAKGAGSLPLRLGYMQKYIKLSLKNLFANKVP
jgi:hypothetical protein